jgi:hypothetical protein
MVVDRHVPKDQNHHASGLIWSGLGQGEFDYINRILLLKHMLQMIFFPGLVVRPRANIITVGDR